MNKGQVINFPLIESSILLVTEPQCELRKLRFSKHGYVRLIPQSLRLQAYWQLASLGSFHKWEECAKSCAPRSVCFCDLSGGGASIFADPFVLSQNRSRIPPGHFPDDKWSVLSVYPKQQRQEGGPRWTLGLIHSGCCQVTEVEESTVCEIRAEVCHLQSSGLSGITRGRVEKTNAEFSQ